MRKSNRKKFPNLQPKSLKDSFQLNSSIFRWTFKYCIWSHKGWQIDIKYFAENIIDKLQQFETQTWQEILNAAGGKSEGHGNNNHFILADELPRNEKLTFINLGYMEKYERVFSLRLSGKERLIGVVDMNVFYILWYDSKHNFF